MPELPEVETIVRHLRETVVTAVIEQVEVILPKVIRTPDPAVFTQMLTNRQVTAVRRRGKYILLGLSGDLVLVVHLRMTGQLIYEPAGGAYPKHTHVVLHLSAGRLRFTDLRRFGRFWLVPIAELDTVSGLRDLGVEPLSPGFRSGDFVAALGRRRGMIKALLLNQCFIAGMGNIYTDEALFRARIHPQRKANEISAAQARNLYRAMQKVLQEGIAFGGTSVRDYVDGRGREGRFQDMLRVYGRRGEPCPRCGEPIARIKTAGRGTYFCPHCQC